MILGMSTAAFTWLHVVISLIALATGALVVIALTRGTLLGRWTQVFLFFTGATSVTGFLFHSAAFGPPHVVGIISLVVLAFAVGALYLRRLGGRWRWIYVASATVALYLNSFVAVVQAFEKVSVLRPLNNGPVFAGAQLLVLAGFVALGSIAVRRLHPRMSVP